MISFSLIRTNLLVLFHWKHRIRLTQSVVNFLMQFHHGGDQYHVFSCVKSRYTDNKIINKLRLVPEIWAKPPKHPSSLGPAADRLVFKCGTVSTLKETFFKCTNHRWRINNWHGKDFFSYVSLFCRNWTDQMRRKRRACFLAIWILHGFLSLSTSCSIPRILDYSSLLQ